MNKIIERISQEIFRTSPETKEVSVQIGLRIEPIK